RPIIAYGQGGATETVIPDETGVFFNQQTWESLLQTLLDFNPHTWDSTKIQQHAQNFSTEKFKTAIQKNVQEKYENFKV
ncbi:MAG: glycosyl transferase group 1, partial [uncultured bacterium]